MPAWAPVNRMTKATLPAGQVHTNQYRHDNMRVKNVTPSGTEQFVWDGDGLPDLMFVVGSGGAAGHLAVRGKNLSRMVGTYGGGGSLREQFHLDRQESVIAVTGLYGGMPATDLRNKFNAFGELYSAQFAGVNYAYVGGQGYWHDFDLGMDYVRNRWLENSLGRWASRDPIGFAGGDWNLWGYVGNSPTVGADPMGLLPLVTVFCSGSDNKGIRDSKYILDAVSVICKNVQGLTNADQCIGENEKAANRYKPPTCLQDFCAGKLKPISIRCIGKFGGSCSDVGSNDCAKTGVGSDLINIRAPALPSRGTPKGKCKPIECVLLHEMLHICNLSHEPGIRNDNMSWYDRCEVFNCISKVLPKCDGYFRYGGHTKDVPTYPKSDECCKITD